MKMQRLFCVGLVALSVLSISCDDDNDPVTPRTPTQFTATLDDANERPTPVVTSTNATGSATFTVNADGSIAYTVRVANTTSRVTACHIHAGGSDAMGPVLVTLCNTTTLPTAAITTETVIATGTITKGVNASEVGKSPVDMDTLLEMLVNGDAYANVHTQTNGTGEIRGQITPVT